MVRVTKGNVREDVIQWRFTYRLRMKSDCSLYHFGKVPRGAEQAELEGKSPRQRASFWMEPREHGLIVLQRKGTNHHLPSKDGRRIFVSVNDSLDVAFWRAERMWAIGISRQKKILTIRRYHSWVGVEHVMCASSRRDMVNVKFESLLVVQ
jgi:hypothetical protein